jgi:hypothetical protein
MNLDFRWPIAGRRLAALSLACAAVLGATAARAEFVRVTAANTVGNALYDVTSFTPPPGTVNPLNTDGASHGRFSAVVQVPNVPAGTVDVLAADLTRGQIIRYRPTVGATSAAVITVWTYTGAGSGPAHPDGLSVDADGNLYMVTSKLNDSSTNQVWVLKANPGRATGYDPVPLLVDGTFASANGVKYLAETAVATTSGPAMGAGGLPAWGPGDLLVLVGNGSNSNSQNNSNDADVLVYRAATLASVLANGGPRTSPDAMLLTPAQFPPGEYPVGIDFWPAEVSNPNPTIVIATSAGRVLRYDFSAAACTPATPPCYSVFASGLGAGLQKIKVGLQLQVPYAFLTQILSGSPGRILQLGKPASPNTTNLIGAATQGVNNPDGLAVARAKAVQASSCVITSTTYPLNLPCDLSLGALQHGILLGGQPGVSGNVIENSCVVLSDPRIHNGVCDGTTLDVATLCPGFGHELLPGTMCGAAGVTGKGFALLRTIASGVDNKPGVLVYNLGNVDNILPGISNPTCPDAALAWAPRQEAGSGEGTIVETEGGYPDFLEMTGFCDASGTGTRGMSVHAVGLALNPAAIASAGGLAGFVDAKYANLQTTIDRANIVDTAANPVKSTLKASLNQVGTYIAEAKTHSYGSPAANADYSCAAAQIIAVDALVQADPSPVANYPGDSANPNPLGEVRGRLANLYYTINSRLLGAAPNKTWPLDTNPQNPNHDTPATCPMPQVNITASPALVAPGGSSTLNWRVDNATSCTALDGNPGDGWGPDGNPKPVLGNTSQLIAGIPGTTTYTLLCSGAGGSNGNSAIVMVESPPVIQSFGAQAAAVNDGSGTTLSWVVTTANGPPQGNVSCSVSSSDGSLSVSGRLATDSVPTGPISAQSQPKAVTYTLSCQNALGGVTSPINNTTTVTAVPLPTISAFTASRVFATANLDPLTLAWNANVFPAFGGACSITSAGNTVSRSGLAPSGSLTIASLAASDSFNLVCGNGLGRTVTSAPIAVTVVPPPTTSALSASPAIVTDGAAAQLSWTAGPGTSCAFTATSGPTVGSPVTGANGVTSISTGPLAAAGASVQSYSYTLICANLAGLTVQSPPLTVQSAPLSSLTGAFTAAASRLTTGESTTLSWSAANAVSCDVTGGGLQAAPAAAPFTVVPPTGVNNYILACTNQAGTRTSFSGNPATVTAVAKATIGSFTATPSTILKGLGAATLSWSATTSGGTCAIASADGNFNRNNLPATAPPGGLSTGVLTKSQSYTLTCSNGIDPAGNAALTITVSVSERAVVANSVGNLVYDVTSLTPAPGAISALNSDGASHGSYRALVLAPNATTGTLDALLADATRGQLVRYTPGAAPVTVFSYKNTGPAHPDGLSLDAAANLYVVTSKINDSTVNGVWKMGAGSGYAIPTLVDNTFQGAKGVKQLRETLVATAATATSAWSAGDLLVLVGNDSSSNSQPNSNTASVLVYRQASLNSLPRSGPDLMAITPAQFPAGEYPVGMDVWPADAVITHPTLLVATSAGRVLRYDFSATSCAPAAAPCYKVFASNLGSGLNKLKVGARNGVPYAFVTQTITGSTGRIVQLAAPTGTGSNPPIATVTVAGVNSPNGIVVTQ